MNIKNTGSRYIQAGAGPGGSCRGLRTPGSPVLTGDTKAQECQSLSPFVQYLGPGYIFAPNTFPPAKVLF